MSSAKTFMEKIFHGELDESVLHSSPPQYDPARIERIAEGFREVLEEFPPEEMERAGRIPPEALERMGEKGLFGFSIAEEYGGLGFNLWEYLRAVEELVKQDLSVAMASLAHLSIGVKAIQIFGSEEQKQKYLVPAASGAMIFAFALTEPRVGSDSQHIETHATLSEDGTHYILNGRKTYITNGNYAHAMTVFAQLDPAHPGFMGAFVVETHREGVKIGKDMPKMGLKASSTAAIQFRDVRVPVENLLGRPGDGFKIAMTVLNYGRLGLGAASAAMMKRSLEDMVKRADTRTQFGQPIRNYPLVQEKIVRTRVNALATRAVNDLVARLLEQDPVANVAMETSHCKLLGTTHGWEAVYDALQVAGGSGYIATNPYEKRMRDFRVATVFEGTTEIHSIYPALFALRGLSRSFQGRASLPFALVSTLLREQFGRKPARNAQRPIPCSSRIRRKAVALCHTLARRLRRNTLLAMLIYGKNLPEKQFLLRRLTGISLHIFTLLAVVARLNTDEKEGRLEKGDIASLEYLMENARLEMRDLGRLRDSRKERLQKVLMEDLTPRSAGGHSSLPDGDRGKGA